MANELTLAINATLSNGSLKAVFQPGSVQVDQAAVGAHMPVLSIGTSEETISLGDVSTAGYVCLRNLDATNYVELGPDSTGMVAMLKLKAGEVACFRLTSCTLKAQANTAAVKLQVMIFED